MKQINVSSNLRKCGLGWRLFKFGFVFKRKLTHHVSRFPKDNDNVTRFLGFIFVYLFIFFKWNKSFFSWRWTELKKRIWIWKEFSSFSKPFSESLSVRALPIFRIKLGLSARISLSLEFHVIPCLQFKHLALKGLGDTLKRIQRKCIVSSKRFGSRCSLKISSRSGSRHAAHSAKALWWRDQLLKCLIKKITL